MIILDTNIISELMKGLAGESVLEWFDELPPQPIATTAITVAELHYGLARLAEGKRRNDLTKALHAVLEEDLDGYVLPFDQNAAQAYGLLAARLRLLGTPVGQSDTMIAAITLHRQGTLVTRNVKHFRHCGIEIANPFES